ncbi:hypothetical protein F383_32127 [Gossypium arboreum]|uniref:Uncharacterized protein n=1 Tax=Gossypium arboreum TaxID=29729 RepID=A0A0B0N2C9_GOSAR|nr:hypothetical protein F383_32127 [Gossypium arboreum]
MFSLETLLHVFIRNPSYLKCSTLKTS